MKMSQTRNIGRFRLKAYASVQEPRAYAVHVRHRDSGDQWLLALDVDSLASCEAAVDQLTIDQVTKWTSAAKPLQFPST
jgi:hypothetical protein